MQTIKKIAKKWVDNFKKSPLVDKDSGIFQSGIAHQLFYGKQDETYPSDYPHAFASFFNNSDKEISETVIESLIEYLGFIGIKIRKEAINNHLEKFPDDLNKLTKKCYYIFKTLAHYGTDLDTSNPFQDNNGDLFFLLQIESKESLNSGQLNLFEDLELPNLYSKFFNLPYGYEDDPTIKKLFDRIENSNDSFFITGKAGTGKSTFVHYFAQKTKKKILMTAFTGIAAINVGGQTIHSFFRFPPKPLMPEDEEITIFKEFTQKYKIIEKIDTIVIDEVSMLRSDILEAIDFSLRKNGGDPNKKFGGKQLLFIGDIFQLPPVIDSTNEVEKFLFTEIYDSEYFFDSLSYKEITPTYFEFKKSHRQKNDIAFMELLDQVRICESGEQTLSKLNERYNPNYTPKLDEFVITLTANNAIAKAENAKKLLGIPYTKFDFEAEVTGEFREDKYPTAKTLELKKNAQVIFIKNDLGKKWVNGTIAKIDFISGDLIEIRLRDGSTHKLEPVTWENRKYKYNKEKRKIVSEVIGTFTQYPIKLAWAITIHKSQGLTFENVIIDMGKGAFVNGQVYTALSRCRTLQGITLKKKINKEDIIADNRIIEFHKSNSTQSILDILNLDAYFTIKLISLYYSLSSKEIEEYWDVLQHGDAHYSVFFSDTDTVHIPKLGLCFNKNLDWTYELKSKWQVGFNNPFIGYTEGKGGLSVEFDKKDELREMLPLDHIKEIDILNGCLIEHWSAVIAPYQDWENEKDFEVPFQYDLNKFKNDIPQLGFEEFKNLYEKDKLLIIWNESIWKNTLKEILTSEIINQILNRAKYRSR
jgi:ATP-dependent DNA helicase PIF1